MAPLEIPLEDLEAGHQSANTQAIQFQYNQNSRRVAECNGCSGCCTGTVFIPNLWDGCSISWRGTAILFAMMVFITLIFWFSKKAYISIEIGT
ncbi:hypothetical protein B0T25DRAFT_563082 [Lasiosphaeria hispida]|uniref:Uncharacterized protein n=1 Tax=Lasiosphaeria hispida TaxID=260671 RepID=A0AAJ0HWQ1_9PEZI|nr:hypothetical protein B0T25DRAFT_563082 [Lasiosphaeria hispida]